MRFHDVHIESFAYVAPERVVTSAAIEARLAPIYERLRLSEGRIELMSGIRERRFFEPVLRPSQAAARAGELALRASDIDRAHIGCLIHAGVCRDHIEPATASFVHRALELRPACNVFDISNACLGFTNAMVVVAQMIEACAIEAALVVAGENGEPLIERTIEALLAAPPDARANRDALKRAYASLTIGSGAAACVLAHSSIARNPRRLLAAAARAASEHVDLCRGDVDGDGLLMETDSEALLLAGNTLAQATWTDFERESGWTRADVDRVVTHQVGASHRRLILGSLRLPPERDFPTYETFGNVGSVSLPLTFACAEEHGFIRPNDRVALLGIGSGLNCQMLAVR
ncbi:MAG: 3-oxoacyl-ACP synthase III [Planctomycetes bacterium]|nr:3-oxoacyl-ACP synthase III [Planctomycetota bacterium]